MGQFLAVDMKVVHLSERVGEFVVDPGQRGEKGHWIVVESHADLVCDEGLLEAHLIGFPQRRHLGEDQRFEPAGVGVGERKTVKPFQLLGMRRRFSSTVRRATSVGCAVKTGTTFILRRISSACSLLIPRRASASECLERNLPAPAVRDAIWLHDDGACGG